MVSSESENAARTAFDEYLRRRCPGISLDWRLGNDPPDLVLEVGNAVFAVEVTALVKQQGFGGTQLPMRVIARELDRFVTEVEVSLREAGRLRGTFIVHIPRPIPHLNKSRCEIRERIADAVRNLEEGPVGGEREFLAVGRRRCLVSKIYDDGASLLLGGPTDSRWRAEASQELSDIVADRMRAKVHRLRTIAEPVILLLHDRYPFSDTAMLTHCRYDPYLAQSFHSVFVAGSGTRGVLLKSGLRGLTGVWEK